MFKTIKFYFIWKEKTMVALRGTPIQILDDYVSFKPPQIPGSQKCAAGCIPKPAPLSLADVRSMTCVRERWKRDECNYPTTYKVTFKYTPYFCQNKVEI